MVFGFRKWASPFGGFSAQMSGECRKKVGNLRVTPKRRG